MATFSSRFSKVRLLLAIVSTVSLTLGGASFTYAQDIPTPTPPADGGEFEGAPDPTPDPELETEAVEPEVTDVVDVVPENEPASIDLEDTDPELPADVTDDPDASLEEVSDNPDSTELPRDTALPTDDIVEDPSVDNDAGTDNTETDSEPGETAPANNSPRGLW